MLITSTPNSIPTATNPDGSAQFPVNVTVVSSLVPVAVGAFSDGSIATIGTTADTAWPGSGGSTVVAALKAIYAAVAGTLSTIATAVTNPLKVDGSGIIQPVSAFSLPLPDGASSTSDIMAVRMALGSPAQDTTLTGISVVLGTPMQQTGGSVGVNNFPATPAVNADGGSLAHVTNFPQGQAPMANSLSVAIAGDQVIPPGDRVRNVLISAELSFIAAQPMNGFIPMEVPMFQAGY
jgi:hypothetical protein